jgi:hypothetical protein
MNVACARQAIFARVDAAGIRIRLSLATLSVAFMRSADLAAPRSYTGCALSWIAAGQLFTWRRQLLAEAIANGAATDDAW